MAAILEEFQQLFTESPGLKLLVVRKVDALAGDASNRNYYRVTATEPGSGKVRSFIFLRYGSAKGPAFKQPVNVSQEQALRQLSRFFAERGLPVPRLYLHDEISRSFVFEDCGDLSLATLASGHQSAVVDSLNDRFGPDWVERLFERAVDLVSSLQSLPPDVNCVAFLRWLEFENYRAEAQEFIEFLAEPRGLTKSSQAVLKKQFDALSETIMSFPKRLSHFDFHGHNILVRDDGALVLIDYQDACLMSPTRDIVSLFNDCGMDEVLGSSRHARLLAYAKEKLPELKGFEHCYHMTLLHWDFRVSGRFLKLCKTKNTERYLQWVPGTLRRLGRTLAASHQELHGMSDVLEILQRLLPEFKDGMAGL